MRQFAASVLAIPILALVYGPVFARRILAGRMGIGFGTLAIGGILVVGLAAPIQTQAHPPVTASPVGPEALAGNIEAHHGLRESVRLSFSAPMDAASVAAALSVSPSTPVALSWDQAGQALTVAPTAAWKAGTYYTITIAPSAADTSGQKLNGPARAIFTTRSAIGGRIVPLDVAVAGRLPTATGFLVSYEGPVDGAAVESAFHIKPEVTGSFATTATATGGTAVTFTPDEGLEPDTTYTISVEGAVLDQDGLATTTPEALSVRTARGPTIVRFRPLAGVADAARGGALSVRFTARMDRASTAAAFTARVGTKALKGRLSWAEGDTVLVFQPATALAFGTKVVMSVATTATDRRGTPLAASRSSAFTTEKKPAVARKSARRGGGAATTHIGHGGAVGSGSWHAVETYYLRLMNCTRGGGWVTASGDCSSPGGSGISPLILNSGISSRVSRPYAKYLVNSGICSHFADGDPGDRLRRAGYAGDYRENLGCRSAANPYASVLGTHLFFQNEKPCGGYCHYANMMSTKMKYVGIGVWVGHGRVRLVIDFWEG